MCLFCLFVANYLLCAFFGSKPERFCLLILGGKIRSFDLLKHLARRNDFTLLSYYDGPQDKQYEEEINRIVPTVAVSTGAGIQCRADDQLSQTAAKLCSLRSH